MRSSRSPGEQEKCWCRPPGSHVRQNAWAQRPRCRRNSSFHPAPRARRRAPAARSGKDLLRNLLRYVPSEGLRARSRTGARIMPTPVARASAAMAAAVCWAICGFQVAERLTGAGKTVPVSKPCRPSSINRAGIPRRSCAMTHFWIVLACSGVGLRSCIPPTPRVPHKDSALPGRNTAPEAA